MRRDAIDKFFSDEGMFFPIIGGVILVLCFLLVAFGCVVLWKFIQWVPG